MSDRSAQEIFGEIFSLLGKDPTPQHKRWARKLWELSLDYDFYPGDLGVDELLIHLGLAKAVRNPDFCDKCLDDEPEFVMEYCNSDGTFG